MAVEIELDLDANSATGKIGAVAASLKGLEQVANDIDIDFDADISDITDEIESFADALNSIDTGNLGFVEDLDKVADKLDNALGQEIDVNVDGGGTNSGDSTGADPPEVRVDSGFVEAAKKAQSATDGGERANLLERTYGEHTLMSESDAGDLHKLTEGRLSNLGASDPNFRSGLAGRIGTRTGFGNDPVSMDWRRQFGPESLKAISRGADPSHGATRRVDTLEDRIRDFKQHSVDMVEGFSELMEKRDEAASPISTPFGDNGLNFDKRMSELTGDELSDIMENPAGGGGFMGENNNNEFVDKMAESLAQAQHEAFGDANFSQANFRDFNGDIRGGISETNAEIASATGFQDGGLGDFDVGGFGRRGGRSNQDIIDGSRILSRVDNIRSASDAFEELGGIQSTLGKKFKKLRPTMGKYMQLFAALIPVALALGVQLAGVAAAMGSVAAAGGAIIGLGLLGHGESMAGSFAQAKQEMRSLKREMFQMAQPTMQQFAPIQSRAFDAAPDALRGVFERMEGLTAYEDTLFELGGALAGGMEQAVEVIVQNEQAISQLSTRFAGLIGSGLLNFFEWLIQAASKNQQLLVQLGQDMVKLAVAAYNVSMAIAKVLTAFSPLFDLLVFISEVLNSGIIIGLITMISLLFILGKSAMLVYTLGGAFLTLTGFVADAALMMFGYEMSTWGAVAATLALVAAIGMLTLGAATVIGGAVTAGAMGASGVPGGPGGSGGGMGGGGGGKTVYNDNRSFTVNSGGGDDYASQKATEDTIKRVGETKQAQSLPPVNTTSENSDGKKK